MKISFSTLGCPVWSLPQVIEIALRSGYNGIELRFLEGEASLWKLPSFQGAGLSESRRRIADSGLTVACVDTSCRFDSPENAERERWIEEGVRMAELARELGAPGIRVFGDRVPPGAEREIIRGWIAECLNTLAEKVLGMEVQVWLETHGDFCSSDEVQKILANCHGIGIVWDPAAAFIEHGEEPLQNGAALGRAVRHVHVKDLRRKNDAWIPVLAGEGLFPLAEVRQVTTQLQYNGFISFEWEKKWHPEIEPAEKAIPHFSEWFRREWEKLSATKENQTGRGASR
jgi:sugar phosphate isomerase/epimerase